MLKVNAEGTFVYLRKDFKADPATFEDEKKRAKYKLDGEEHQLVFDGKVDEVVLGRMARATREKAIKDIKQVAPFLDQVAEARPTLDKGERVELDLGDFGKWTGVRRESDFKGKREEAHEYFFSPVEPKRYQTLTFTDNGYVKLETSAFGIRHEVNGRGYRDEDSGGKYKTDTIFYNSEFIGVNPVKRGGKKKAEAPSAAAAEGEVEG